MPDGLTMLGLYRCFILLSPFGSFFITITMCQAVIFVVIHQGISENSFTYEA